MKQVNSPSQFPDDALIMYFSGKNYEEAHKLALERLEKIAHLISYYEQKATGKSILVSYKKKEVENV